MVGVRVQQQNVFITPGFLFFLQIHNVYGKIVNIMKEKEREGKGEGEITNRNICLFASFFLLKRRFHFIGFLF